MEKAETRKAKAIAITGASSGIGAALACAYAEQGVHLVLIGRDRVRLDDVASQCVRQGASVAVAVADVAHREAIVRVLQAADDAMPIDLLIANAGILAGEPGHVSPEPEAETLSQINVNLIGAIHSANALAPRMLIRGRGQIAFTASLAAFTPSPDWPGYCASKAALLSYGQSLRERYRPSGLRINVICPGWVTAPINALYNMWRPFEMSAEEAARIIVKGLARDKGIIAFPRRLALLAPLAAFLPERIRRMTARRFRATRRSNSQESTAS